MPDIAVKVENNLVDKYCYLEYTNVFNRNRTRALKVNVNEWAHTAFRAPGFPPRQFICRSLSLCFQDSYMYDAVKEAQKGVGGSLHLRALHGDII